MALRPNFRAIFSYFSAIFFPIFWGRPFPIFFLFFPISGRRPETYAVAGQRGCKSGGVRSAARRGRSGWTSPVAPPESLESTLCNGVVLKMVQGLIARARLFIWLKDQQWNHRPKSIRTHILNLGVFNSSFWAFSLHPLQKSKF